MRNSPENPLLCLADAAIELEVLENEIRGALQRTWLMLGLLGCSGLGLVIYSQARVLTY